MTAAEPGGSDSIRRLSDRALVVIALLLVVALLASVTVALITLYTPEIAPLSLPTSAKV